MVMSGAPFRLHGLSREGFMMAKRKACRPEREGGRWLSMQAGSGPSWPGSITPR